MSAIMTYKNAKIPAIAASAMGPPIAIAIAQTTAENACSNLMLSLTVVDNYSAIVANPPIYGAPVLRLLAQRATSVSVDKYSIIYFIGLGNLFVHFASTAKVNVKPAAPFALFNCSKINLIFHGTLHSFICHSCSLEYLSSYFISLNSSRIFCNSLRYIDSKLKSDMDRPPIAIILLASTK